MVKYDDDPFGKREAVDRVERHAAEAWSELAYVIGCQLARDQQFFTSIDIVARIPDDVQTHEPRALGAIMRRLAREGFIVKTDQTKNSKIRRNHNREVRVWHSLVWNSPG